MSDRDEFTAYIESLLFRHPTQGWTKVFFMRREDYTTAVRNPFNIPDTQYYDHPDHPAFLKTTQTRNSQSSLSSEQWAAFLQLSQFHGLSPVDSPTSFALRLSVLLSARFRSSNPELNIGDLTSMVFESLSEMGVPFQVLPTPQSISLSQSEVEWVLQELLQFFGDPRQSDIRTLESKWSVPSDNSLKRRIFPGIDFFHPLNQDGSTPDNIQRLLNTISSVCTRRGGDWQLTSPSSLLESASSELLADSWAYFPSPQHCIESASIIHPLDPGCRYFDENLDAYLEDIQRFFDLLSDESARFKLEVKKYFHFLPGLTIPLTGEECQQDVMDLFRVFQRRHLDNKFENHPALKLWDDSSLSPIQTPLPFPKQQIILEEQFTGNTTVKLPSEDLATISAVKLEKKLPLSNNITVKQEKLRDLSVSSVSSAGSDSSGTDVSSRRYARLDSNHPRWKFHVMNCARERAADHICLPGFDVAEYENTIDKVILSSKYPFSADNTLKYIDSIIAHFMKKCSPVPFLIDLVSSDSSSLSSTTLDGALLTHSPIEAKVESELPLALPSEQPSRLPTDIRGYDFALESKAPWWKGHLTPPNIKHFLKLFFPYHQALGARSMADLFTDDVLYDVFNGKPPPLELSLPLSYFIVNF